MIQANTNKHKEEAATIRPNQSSRGDQIMKSEDHLAAETVRQKREPRRWTSSWPCWQRLWWPRRRCWMRCLPSWTPASCRARWHRCRRPAERSRAQGCWLGSAAPSVMDLQTAPLKHQCQPPARSPPLPWSPRAGYEPQGGELKQSMSLSRASPSRPSMVSTGADSGMARMPAPRSIAGPRARPGRTWHASQGAAAGWWVRSWDIDEEYLRIPPMMMKSTRENRSPCEDTDVISDA